ncbi:MAG: hypothetical protein ACM3PW_14310 [Chlamydiota bacterium]
MSLLSTRRVFIIILGLGLFAMAARGVHDPDVWWHLRAGQEIVVIHHVPRQDIFSYTRYGQPWIAHEWLSEVVFYLIFRVAGWTGLTVVFAGVIGGTFLLLYRQCAGRPYIAGLVTALGAITTIPSWGVRPQMFSLLLAAVFLWLLAKARASEPDRMRFLWWMPPLLLLWVNLHGAFLLGPALIGITLAGWLLEAWLGLESWPRAWARLGRLGLVLAACVAVIPLNPNGFELYRYPFQTLQARTIVDYIVEWASPNFHSVDFKPFLGLLLLTWLVVAVSRKRLSPTQILLLLATAYGGLSAVRHIPIFVLVAAPILAEGLDELAARRHWFSATEEKPPAPAKLALNFVFLLAVAGLTGVRFYQAVKGQAAGEAKRYPQAATEFLICEHVPGPIFNYYDWGGYFIAKLYPQYRVFIDGRTDLYGKLMDTFSETSRGEGDWRTALDKYGVRTVVIPPDVGLAGLLRLDPAWKKEFEDKQAVVFVKAGAGR